MKIKHKGKVFPSPSSSPSPPPPSDGDILSTLLPATILALASILSLEDREVLSYMITRSIRTPITTATTSSSSNPSVSDNSKKRGSRKQVTGSVTAAATPHKPPRFDCECFDCYTCYWYRWDSSPNRELIHQVIEAFEDHLSNGELSKKSGGGRGKKKERPGRRVAQKPDTDPSQSEVMAAPGSPLPLPLPQRDTAVEARVPPSVVRTEKELVPMTSPDDRAAPEVAAAADGGHKGLVRKVLPDVLGLLNSRLWNLWNPSV